MLLTLLLSLSVGALVVGAGSALLLQRKGWGIAALKGLMGSVLGGFLLFELWPQIYEKIGAISVLYGVLGFLFVLGLEKVFSRHEHAGEGRFFTAEMVWVGLLIHQLTDGLAISLAAQEGLGFQSLSAVIVAHRVPVAAVVMWIYLSRGSARKGWERLAIMAGATLIGALASHSVLSWLESNHINALMAFISGTFIHLFAHDFIDFHAHNPKDKRAEFFAFSAGVLFFLFMHWNAGSEHEHGEGFWQQFWLLARTSGPYLLLGLSAGGLLFAFMPESPVRWMKRGNAFSQSLKGMTFGLPLPVCSCGVLPLFTSLAKRGIPPAALVAFLIATPELGIDSFLFSVSLLGIKFSLLRLVVAMILPVLAAILFVAIVRQFQVQAEPEKKHCCSSDHCHEKPSWWRYGAIDLVDDLFPLVLLGLVLAALVQNLWPADQPPPFGPGWDVLFLGLLGVPFYVCASASVPLALVLLERGFSVGAVIVFLFAGPATNVATVLAVNKVFGKPKGYLLAGICLVLAMGIGFLANASLDVGALSPPTMNHEHGWHWYEIGSLAILGALAIASLWRSGPLHWISSMLNIVPGLVHHPDTNHHH